ncbi:MAG: hypothetical protein AAGE05_13900 [Pseudomonadota bacterium]
MRIATKFLGGSAMFAATLALTACGGGTETATTDEDTAVTDVDPGEGDGTINDTTLIDGTIGAEEAMGMESRMPADSSGEPAAPAPSGGDEAAEAETPPPAEPEEPAVEAEAGEDGEAEATE